MPYNILTPASLDDVSEISEKNNKSNNKTNNKTNKTIKNKSTKFSDIIENNYIPKKEYQETCISEPYNNLITDDDDNNLCDFKKINNNKPSYNNTQEPYVDYNNNEYEDFNYQNITKNNFGNYDNNYTINNSEFNKHLNNSNRTVDDYNNLNENDINNINNISNKELLTKINYIIHLLEEQRSEKTNYVTEELILYSFLGVFIIFVLDSFSKASKYIR